MNEVKLLNIGGIDQNIKDQYARDVIAPSENGLDSSTNLPVSSRHYDVGEYLIGQTRAYYEVIAEINVGDTIVVGTNVRATTISDELIALKNQSADTVIEIIADKENGALATQSYTVGKYIYWAYGLTAGLYIVTAAISSGDALVVGSGGNIAPANKVCDDIKELKENVEILKTKVCKPNLLDNSWFTINQRGLSVYSGYNDNYFAVDRWKFTNDLSVSINSDFSINVTNNTQSIGNSWFGQAIPMNSIDLHTGDVVTQSIMLSDGTIFSHTAQIPGGGSWNDKRIAQKGIQSIRIQQLIDGVYFAVFFIEANATANIVAAKVEKGSESTLHMDRMPSFAIELEKCQRYYFRTTLRGTRHTSYQVPFLGSDDVNNWVYLGGVSFPTVMRSAPSVKVFNVSDVFLRSNVQSPSVQYMETTKDGITFFRFGKGPEYVDGYTYMIHFEATADI